MLHFNFTILNIIVDIEGISHLTLHHPFQYHGYMFRATYFFLRLHTIYLFHPGKWRAKVMENKDWLMEQARWGSIRYYPSSSDPWYPWATIFDPPTIDNSWWPPAQAQSQWVSTTWQATLSRWHLWDRGQLPKVGWLDSISKLKPILQVGHWLNAC